MTARIVATDLGPRVLVYAHQGTVDRVQALHEDLVRVAMRDGQVLVMDRATAAQAYFALVAEQRRRSLGACLAAVRREEQIGAWSPDFVRRQRS